MSLFTSRIVGFASIWLAPALALAMGGNSVGQLQALQGAQGTVVCGSTPMPTAGNLNYCLQPGNRNQVILSFPGVWNTEHSYQDALRSALYNSYRSLGAQPTIFTMTIGRIAFLNGAVRSSGKTDVQEVLDAVSETLVKNGFPDLYANPGSVNLLGESMGGHNSIMMYLRAPQLFRKFGLMCPALSRQSPFNSEPDWFENMDPDADWYRSIGYKTSMMFFFGNAGVWNTASPLMYAAQSYRPLAKPGPIFVAHVKEDYFGFNSGGRAFEQLMRSKGHPVETSETAGRTHCFIQTDAIAKFLIQ